jgi:hypothetical protein
MRRIPYHSNKELYRRHYCQHGKGFPVYKGEFHQQGYGLGGILSSMFKSVIPLAMPVIKKMGKRLLSSGVKVARNVIVKKRPIKRALQEEAIQQFDRLTTPNSNVIKSRKMRHVKKNRKVSNKRKSSKRKKYSDIFD